MAAMDSDLGTPAYLAGGGADGGCGGRLPLAAFLVVCSGLGLDAFFFY